MEKQSALDILASKPNGTLYVGVTSNLVGRVWQHQNDLVEGCTRNYAVHRWVYYEMHSEMAEAIFREKRVQRWNRAWKIRMIEKMNVEWQDCLRVSGPIDDAVSLCIGP